jgi:hypothetical protein
MSCLAPALQTAKVWSNDSSRPSSTTQAGTRTTRKRFYPRLQGSGVRSNSRMTIAAVDVDHVLFQAHLDRQTLPLDGSG